MINGETPGPKQKEVVSERTDEAAEETFIKEFQVNAMRDQLVDTFDKGISALSDDKEFKVAFRKALDTLIQNTVSQLVNVNDLSTLPLHEKVLVHAKVMGKMAQFRAVLEAGTGVRRDVSDVEDTKKVFKDIFSYKEFDLAERISYGRVEGGNDAAVTMSLEGTVDEPQSLDISYQEPEGAPVHMSIKTNGAYFASTEETVSGSLAEKIRRNRDAYLVTGVNYRIEDPKQFQRFLQVQLNRMALDPKTLSEREGLDAAVEIVKANLQSASGKEYEKIMSDEEHSSNTTPIDQLLIGKGYAVCRHYAAASRVVFEEIQRMAEAAKNEALKDTVVFENYMEYMGHGTLGIARGNSVTTMDAYWYAQGAQDSKDATFDGKHGNVSSLYHTLSRIPNDRPEDKIFDLGNLSQMPSALQEVFGDEALSKLDNRQQSVLAMANGVWENEKLHSVANLLGASKNLVTITREVLSMNQENAVTNVLLHGIGQIAKKLDEVLREKIKEPLSQEDKEDLELSHAYLAFAQRRVSGGSVLTNEDETSGLSESAKEKFNYERAAALYVEANSKINQSIRVGHGRYSQETSLENNGKFKKELLDPATASAQGLVDFVLKEKIIDKQEVSDTIRKYVLYLNSKISALKGLGKIAAEAALPILKKIL